MEKKNLVMVVLCVAIGVMAVAYAAFSTTLNVNGTVEAVGDFAVEFTETTVNCSLAAKDTTVSAKTSVFTKTSATAGDLALYLYTPGDVVTCTIPIKNTGDLSAKLNGDVQLNSTTTTPAITVKVTSAPATLNANASGNVVITATYNDVTEQPESLSTQFTVVANYVQNLNS